MDEDEARLRRRQKALTIAAVAALALTVLAYARKGTFVSHRDIDPRLLNEPAQAETTRAPFSFEYMGEGYEVQPVAEYDIAGLVVSHNDPTSWWDVYHDAASVDTKDLGLIWGPNLRSDDFHRVKFWNVSWTVNWQWPAGVTFHSDAISNNHLVTPHQRIRDTIAGIRVGDQVRLKGLLVNYAPRSRPDMWRTSSTTRADTGNGACEVLCVDELQVLRRGTPLAYPLYSLGKLVLALALLGKVGLFFYESSRRTPRPPPSPPTFTGLRPPLPPLP